MDKHLECIRSSRPIDPPRPSCSDLRPAIFSIRRLRENCAYPTHTTREKRINMLNECFDCPPIAGSSRREEKKCPKSVKQNKRRKVPTTSEGLGLGSCQRYVQRTQYISIYVGVFFSFGLLSGDQR